MHVRGVILKCILLIYVVLGTARDGSVAMNLLLIPGTFRTLPSCDFRKEKSHVPDLRVQLDVFDDQRDTDEELSNQGPPGIDLSSHVDVFYAILGQVCLFSSDFIARLHMRDYGYAKCLYDA